MYLSVKLRMCVCAYISTYIHYMYAHMCTIL